MSAPTMVVCSHTPRPDEGCFDRPGVDARCDKCARPMDPTAKWGQFRDPVAHAIYNKHKRLSLNHGGAS